MFTYADLRPYQLGFIGKIKQSFHPDPKLKLPGCMIAMEPGGGKTVTVLTAVSELLNEGKIKKVLIVAPLLVAQTVWPFETHEWEHLQHLQPLLLRVEEDDPELVEYVTPIYQAELARHQTDFDIDREANWLLGASKSEARRQARKHKTPSELADEVRSAAAEEFRVKKLYDLAESDAPIHVINREALDKLWEYFGRGKRWPYDALFIDDCREGGSGKKRVKRDSKEDKAAAPLSRFGIMGAARKFMKATFQLNGTPTANGLHRMWGLIYLIDLGERLGAAKTPFYKRYFEMNEYHQPTKPKEGALTAITDKVKDVMFSLRDEDRPQLPEYLPDPIRVKLEPEVLKEYRKFCRTLVSDVYDIEAASSGVMHLKKLQWANGSVYNENGEDVWVHDAKLNALKLLVERLDGTPLLVAYDFEFDKQRILKAFKDAVLLTPANAVKFTQDWNDDKIRIGLAHRAAAGHGINAQKGTGHICDYGLTTDAELHLQWVKRIHRSGRKTKVINHIIIAEGTIDEEVYPKYLDPKVASQNTVLGKLAFNIPFKIDLCDILDT